MGDFFCSATSAGSPFDPRVPTIFNKTVSNKVKEQDEQREEKQALAILRSVCA